MGLADVWRRVCYDLRMLFLGNLLPEVWFADTHGLLLMAIVVFAMFCVIKGADWLVEGAAGIAKRLGMPEVIIGATIVSLGTTTPEAAVSVLAAWSGDAGLALGNGVGSIIADTGLIFGVGCLMCALPADRFVLSRQGWVQFGAGLLLALLCVGAYMIMGDEAVLGRWVGVLLVGLLVGYLVISVKWSRMHPHGEPRLVSEEETVEARGYEERSKEDRGVGVLLGMGLAGLVLVIFSGDGLVQAVTVLAEKAGIPQVVIASTLVAFGTSLPELVVGVTAIRKGHAELLVGNVIGADILNVLFVIGVSAMAAPLGIVDMKANVPEIFLYMHLPVMVGMLVLMRIFIAGSVKTGAFKRWMGVPLVAGYVFFVGLQYWLSA
ncbi:Inner membrane protein YrbG [Poriferisphaera corsica]|uniref:Inner membrane protein YrbG n=1 Tax=Poriferisphaera corsica TaxID=2528020 RepID=A0A517YXP8_9BACT|nr:sodium:calcium antiporter [Poriferisphaera corsica]QDU35003.1 Inner membrane protein YrbG [Poriferisphaera corsica]